MDKSWMNLDDRTLPEYENGVNQFLDFAYSSVDLSTKIRCPCRKCNNVLYYGRDDVEADLFQYGIIKDYDPWEFHGEDYFQNSMSEDEDFVEVIGPEKSTHLRDCGDGLEPPFKRGHRVNEELGEENEELKRQVKENRDPPPKRGLRANEELHKENEELKSQAKENYEPASKRGHRLNEELVSENEELKKQAKENRECLEALERRIEILESQMNNQEAQVQSQVQAALRIQLHVLIQTLSQMCQVPQKSV